MDFLPIITNMCSEKKCEAMHSRRPVLHGHVDHRAELNHKNITNGDGLEDSDHKIVRQLRNGTKARAKIFVHRFRGFLLFPG